MRLLVCGGRDFKDYGLMQRVLIDFCNQHPEEIVLIHGNARGADKMAALLWEVWHKPAVAYPAQWSLYGKKAGIIRNVQMLKEGKPDHVLAFPGGKGTGHMVQIAIEAGIPVTEIGA